MASPKATFRQLEYAAQTENQRAYFEKEVKRRVAGRWLT